MILSEAEKHSEGEMTSADVGTPWEKGCKKPERTTLTLNGHDELGNHGQDPGASVLQHVVDPLAGEDGVRMSGLA